MFDAVLNYYRIGKLHAPRDVCGPAFEEELQFWGIDEKQIEACCWSYHTTHRDAQETLAKMNGPNFENSDSEEEEDVAKIFGIEEVYERTTTSWYGRWQPRIWTMLEEPYSSRAAKVRCAKALAQISINGASLKCCLTKSVANRMMLDQHFCVTHFERSTEL